MLISMMTALAIPATAATPTPAAPRAPLYTYLSPDDYPAAALRVEAEGTTGVRLTIGRDGRVTGCDITSSAGSSILDQATCQLLRRRARFTPAQDERGLPIEGSYTTRISWRLPQPQPVPFIRNRHVMTVTLADGFARSCTLDADLPHLPAAPGALVCPSMVSPAPPQVPRNGTIKVMLLFEPKDSAPPIILTPAPRGAQDFSVHADIEVEPSGRVSACSANMNGRPHPRPEVVCGSFTNGRTIFEAAPSQDVRRATIRAITRMEGQ